MKIRLAKNLPNWVPMYGKKVCFEYPGVRRQCNNCYGPHAKKYCKSERVGMVNFVKGFSARYNSVPEELYGKLSIYAMSKVLATETVSKAPTAKPARTGPSTFPEPDPGSSSVTSKNTQRLQFCVMVNP